jgi:regulator of cell morphogenesis and NO signaling
MNIAPHAAKRRELTMKITDAFLGEHGVLYPQLDELERAALHAAGDLREQAVLLAAGLVSHAELEEQLLFGHMENLIGADGGPLAVMRIEHQEVESLLAELQESGPGEDACDLAARLVALARDHFAKEEQILFPMAEEMMGEQRLLELGREWAGRRLPRRAA